MLFGKKDSQLDRITHKLEKAMRKDQTLEVFGASSHKYKVNEKLTAKELANWQATHQVALPESYTQFLQKIGNGGAGPYYGIYSLDKATTYTETHTLTAKCILRPKMTKEEWNHLTEPLNSDEDISDLEYDAARDKVLGGMLCIGTQGCEYDMYLVLEGKHRGKVVYTSDFHPDHPFFFVYEDSFLDWYERWLDEIILDYDIGWFGSRMGGDEAKLMQVYQNAPNEEIQLKALDGMFKLKKLSKPTIQFLEGVAEKRQQDRITAIQLICKTSIGAGRDLLLELLRAENNEDFVQAIMILRANRRSPAIKEFLTVIKQSLKRVHDPETLRYVGYVLESADAITLADFGPFLCHTNPNMQTTAIYATRNCKQKSKDWKIIEQMLSGGSPEVMRNVILYWDMVPHEKLLPYYKAAWPEYKSRIHFRETCTAGLKALNLPDDYFDQ